MPSPSSRIIRCNTDLASCYDDLRTGDVIINRLRLKPTEEHLVLDLTARGIILIPSGLSQLLCRSKTFQSRVFRGAMFPNTLDIHDIHDLLAAMNRYARTGIGRCVTKLDRKNGGLGVFLWENVEMVFTQASLGTLPYPFVLQPYHPSCVDVRVLILDYYLEAYERHNDTNFRNNLHFGGTARPVALREEQRALCHDIMARGSFPYAHIDLIITPGGETFFSEINLRGGIKGAAINPNEYRARIDAIHEKLLQRFLAGRQEDRSLATSEASGS